MIIPFPKREERPINWEDIEAERLNLYPKIPKRAVGLMRRILEQKSEFSDSYILVSNTGGGYPPNPIPVSRHKHGLVWVIDLLDRFGGELVSGSDRCKVRRSKKRLPVFMITEISAQEYIALISALGHEFEHLVRSKTWQMLGKELPGVDLLAVLINSRNDAGKKYLGLFDRRTIMILFKRLGEGLSTEDLISWGL